LLQEAVLKWKNHFISKYGDFNLLHIKDLSNIDLNFLAENLFASSFLSEKKLIIIDLNNELDEKLSEFFINSLKKIPENNILVFSYLNPDKRLKLYKELEKSAEKKEFSLENENETFVIIEKKYS
jgi:DNA polymerase III delta subunit